MIYNEHPGSWPLFLKRKDIIGLSIPEARKQYLIEQQGFNSAASSAAAAAAAAAAANSSGGLVRQTRIAAEKGYKIKNEASTTTAVTRTTRRYEEFFYGKPADNKVSGNSGNPVWEIQLTKGRPSDFPYGFCVWDPTSKRWFLTNDYTDDDSTGASAYALGDIGGVNIWGTYTKVSGSGTLEVSQAASTAYPKIYCDQWDSANGADSYIIKAYQTPILYNNVPVYFDCKNSVVIVYCNAVDPDGTFEDIGLQIGDSVGLGWNMSETDGENIYEDLANITSTDSNNAPYFQNVTGSNPGVSSTMLTDPSTPSGSFIQEQAEDEGYPTPLVMSANVNDFPITANVRISAFGTDLNNKTLLLSGSTINDRPCWQIDPTDAGRQDLLYWNNKNWILTQTSSLSTRFTLSNDPLSPDGDYGRRTIPNNASFSVGFVEA